MTFSLIGTLIAAAIFIPNIIFVIFPPKNMPRVMNNTGFVFTLLERLGQIGCISMLVMLNGHYYANIWLYLMIFCIVVYYGLWWRYIISGQEFAVAFKPLLFIPIPMAIFPILTFTLASLYGNILYMLIPVLMLAIGHIANSYYTYRLIINKKR